MKFCGQNYSTLDSLFLAMCLQELKTSCLLFSGWGSSLYMMWNFSLRHTRHCLLGCMCFHDQLTPNWCHGLLPCLSYPLLSRARWYSGAAASNTSDFWQCHINQFEMSSVPSQGVECWRCWGHMFLYHNVGRSLERKTCNSTNLFHIII